MKFSSLSTLCTGSLVCAASIQPYKRANFPFLNYGDFTIVNCGDNQHRVVTLLQQLPKALIPAMEDVRSHRTSAAYTTFFKDINYATDIFSILKNASTGVRPEGSLFPVVFCATAAGQVPYQDIGTGEKGDMFTRCSANPDQAAIIAYHTRFIILCPTFFTSTVQSLPPAKTCLKTNSAGTNFASDGALTVQYNIWILLDMLAKFYIFWSTKAEFDVVGADGCAGLVARDAVRNGRNYVYYAASVYGRCTQFPNSLSARPMEHELIEVPGNYSMDGAVNATLVH